MSLILGIYSKNRELQAGEFQPVIDDFALSGKRKVQRKTGWNFIFSSALVEGKDEGIHENEDGSLIILFSGHVYDFDEGVSQLEKKGHRFSNRNSSAEFLLHSYEEFGANFLNGLNGTFALALYNRSTDVLLLANDSFGIYPLFVYNSDQYCLFCTEYEPITKYGNIARVPDYDAIVEFFSLGLPLAGKTFFKNVSNLQRGSLLEIDKSATRLRQYDDLNIRTDRSEDVTWYSELIASRVNKAVNARLNNRSPMVCRLSGGADTRLILSNIPKERRKEILFQTEKSPFLDEREDRDVIIAKKIAKKLGLHHSTYDPPVPAYYDERGFGPDFFAARRIRPSSKPLGGWHGSQFLGGICFTMCPIKPEDLSRQTINRRLKRIFSKGFLEKVSDPYITVKNILKDMKADNTELLFIIQQLTRGFFTNIFRGSRSGWLDPHSFPTRFDTVFWDTDFLKAILKIPKKYLAGYRLYNQVYKNHFPELIDIPTNSPLAERSDGCIPSMDKGVEPKKARRPQYLRAFKDYAKNPHTWSKGLYSSRLRREMQLRLRSRKFIPGSQVEDHPLIAAFIDFEAWNRYIGLSFQI